MQRSEADFEVQASSTSDNYYILVLCSQKFVLESLGTRGCRAVAGSCRIGCRFRICSAEFGSWVRSAARQRDAAPLLGGTGLSSAAPAAATSLRLLPPSGQGPQPKWLELLLTFWVLSGTHRLSRLQRFLQHPYRK